MRRQVAIWKSQPNAVKLLVIVGLNVLAVAVRYSLSHYTNYDIWAYLVPWYDHIVEHGGYRALGDAFSNYSPPYIYLLVLATCFRGLIPKIVAIKTISIAFDFLAAIIMYKLVRLKYESGPVPWFAYFAVLFAPTVVINSSYWGQCDIIYATWLLACIYFCCTRKPLPAMLCFSIAFSFKAQAIFLGPFIVMLLFKRQIPWAYTLFLPVVYLLLVLPSALLGRPLFELLTIYLSQADTYHFLSMKAPNLYQFVPSSYYSTAASVGFVAAVAAGLGIALAALKSRANIEKELLLKSATLSVALMPFMLPKMHERYFFPADLISIGLAFYEPRLRLVPLFFQCTSIVAYMPFLKGIEIFPLRLAGILNMLVVGLLLAAYARALFPRR